MLVLNINTKRQRRPNVRLGEIGDVSASFPCKSSLKPKVNVEEKRWEPGSYKLEDWNKSKSPRASIGTQNWENWNPNSRKYDSEAEGTDMKNPRLGFGVVNRKGRLKKQRRWSMRSSGAISSSWHSRVSPENNNKTEKAYVYDNSNDHSFNTDYGCSDHETWNNNGDTCEGNSNGSLPGNSWKEENGLPSDGGQWLSDKTGVTKKMKGGSTLVNGVKEWLVELGFAKYAGIFELHEVDEEALPLLTYEDLKEMGILAVGTRRRIHAAIQLLNKGNSA